MSYSNDDYFTAGNRNLTALACECCGFTVCQCSYHHTSVSPESGYSGAYMAPCSPTYPPFQYLPTRQVEDRYSPQAAEVFPHYNQQEHLPASSYGGGRVVHSALISTFAEGLYTYGQIKDEEARSVERLAAFNHSFIQANDKGAALHEEVFEPEEGIILDGTIDPTKLSLPIVGQKVPCPRCPVLLKDEKSLSRHLDRKHNPNAEFFGCPEPNCQYSTQKRADLARHARARHPQDEDPKPFKCPLCGTGNSRKDNLKRHEVSCARSFRNSLALLSVVTPSPSASA